MSGSSSNLPRVPTDTDRVIGQRLFELRRDRNLSQTDIAQMVGISFQQIQKYEKGRNRIPIGRFLEICHALNVAPAFFIDPLMRENTK